MNRKSAITIYLTALLVCAVVTTGIVGFRGDLSFRTCLDATTFVALGMVVLGVLAQSGAATGPDVLAEEAVSRTSTDPAEYLAADNDDARRGIAFGWVIIAAGATWLAIAGTVYLVSKQLCSQGA